MIGGLFVGLADGIAPGIGVVGFDVFVLGEGQDLDEGLAEIQRRKADPSLPLGSARTAAHLGRRALHDNGRSRPRAGGSEDPPLGRALRFAQAGTR